MHISLNGKDCQILPGQYLNISQAMSGNFTDINTLISLAYISAKSLAAMV